MRSESPYRVPLVVGVLSIGGLLTALVGDGLWNVISWALVATPLFAVAAALFRNQNKQLRRKA